MKLLDLIEELHFLTASALFVVRSSYFRSELVLPTGNNVGYSRWLRKLMKTQDSIMHELHKGCLKIK
jgi:hypothetical protein